MSLFDINEIPIAPGKTPRKPKAPPKPKDPPPPTIAVLTDDRWRFGHRKTPGVIHATTGRTRLGAHVVFCGLIGMPLSYRPGEVVHGCCNCIDAGASFAEPLAS